MEELCLKWTNYQSSLSSVFQNLRDTDQFTDVTLSTSEGNSLRAHRIVLCAASSYFRNVLSGTNCWQHPVIILKDLPFPDLEYIIEFIYTGTVSIPPEKLSSLLQTAKFLTISGLSTQSIDELDLSPSSKKIKTCTLDESSRKVQMKEVNGNSSKSQDHQLVKVEPLDIGPEEMSSSYARAKNYDESSGTNTSQDGVLNVEPSTYNASRDITESMYDENRENPSSSSERVSGEDSGPLTCLVCRATLSNCNALYYHMNYVHSGGVEPGDIIRNIGNVLGNGSENVKTEERD